MITDRNSLQEYLQADRTALGMSGKRPSIFGQEVWKYERALRYVEYYQNVGGGYWKTILEMEVSSAWRETRIPYLPKLLRKRA